MLTNEEEVKQAQDNLLQTFPTPPKVVIIVGDPGWLVSAPIFDGPGKISLSYFAIHADEFPLLCKHYWQKLL